MTTCDRSARCRTVVSAIVRLRDTAVHAAAEDEVVEAGDEVGAPVPSEPIHVSNFFALTSNRLV